MKNRLVLVMLIIFVLVLCSCSDGNFPLMVGSKTDRGGYIFYDKGDYEDGWRYLEAAPAGWYGSSIDPLMKFADDNEYIGTTVEALGGGKANTDDLLYGLAFYPAASACNDYTRTVKGKKYDDWFLPSHNELIEMNLRLYQKGLGGLSEGVYWSSTAVVDDSNNKAIAIGINSYSYHYIYTWYRSTTYYVRPIRRF